MVRLRGTWAAVTVAAALFAPALVATAGVPIAFSKSTLQGASPNAPTTLQIGPDGRLYVAEQSGWIRVYTVVRQSANHYAVTATESIALVRAIPNHNDDGSPNAQVSRLVTGLLVTGTSLDPVIYVSSSDSRIVAGSDSGLDTNSGVISRIRRVGGVWTRLDLVRGLPRCEENHATNGMQLDAKANVLYVAQGGNTNMGAPSENFGLTPEYALSAAILSIDLDAIGESTYDLPTLDDLARANSGPGGADVNDPFGGNDGANQARIVPGGPVQVFSPGYRNPYDIVLTAAGRLYTIDNGPNNGWGGPPINCSNAPNDGADNSYDDSLHLVTPGFYGGHPNPWRASTANTVNGQSPVTVSNPVECEYEVPGDDDGSLATWDASTNGLTEYTASNFGGAMQGNLLAAAWNTNSIERIVLSASGESVVETDTLFATVGDSPLDVTAQGDGEYLAGTIWVADHDQDNIVVFEPVDLVTCNGTADPLLDEDGDGFTNADEVGSGSNPCSPGSVPSDFDGDLTSDMSDTDDDGDGLPDTSDPFAYDALNGLALAPPFSYGWDGGEPGYGLLGLGFTGLMSNSTDDPLDLFDTENITAGGAAGKLTIDAVPAGSALDDTQAYAFQLGVNVSPATGRFLVRTRVEGPLFDGAPQNGQALGLFIGDGSQNEYLSVTVIPNGGTGGIAVIAETAGVAEIATHGAKVLNASSLDLGILVDPVAESAQPRFAVNGGAWFDAGPPVALRGGALDAVQGAQALAAGIIATSGGAAPFTATWDLLEVSLVGSGARAIFAVDPTGNAIDASTYTSGSFIVMNDSTQGEQITSVSIDLRTSMLPDVVYDPDGLAGDSVAKDFTPDTGASETGLDGHTFTSAHDEGWDVLTVEFDDFEPDETFTFSLDLDPTSVQGSDGSVEAGSISGLELVGAQVSVEFDDGTTRVSALAHVAGSIDAGAAIVRDGAPPAPLVSLNGWSGPPPPGGEPPLVLDASQTVRITGPAGAAVRVRIAQAGLFTSGVPGGGFDLDPFEVNRVVSVDEEFATIAPAGFVDVAIVLQHSAQATTSLITAQIEEGGESGPPSNVLAVRLGTADVVAKPASIDFGNVVLGETPALTLANSVEGDAPVAVTGIEIDGAPLFAIESAPALPLTLVPGAPGFTVAVRFAPLRAGAAAGTLRIIHEGNNSPLEIPIAGSGVVGAGGVIYRVNCGGAQLAAPDGREPVWSQDQASDEDDANGAANPGTPSPYVDDDVTETYGITGSVTPNASVPASVPSVLFRTERFDPSGNADMEWAFPVAVGTKVQVDLLFAEIFSGNNQPGERIFDVEIEGVIILDNLDQVATAGYRVGFMRSTVVVVLDGYLDIAFRRVVEDPSIKGIQIVSLGCPADVTGDGVVGFADLVEILLYWGPCTGACPADVDASGDVGFGDLTAVLLSWNGC